MNKKALIPMAILATLAIPSVAVATVATATPTCGGLAWSVTHYSANKTNAIVVKVDGGVVYQDLNFGATDQGQVGWSQDAPHTWSVKVDAPGTQYDKAFAGTWQPCQTTTTTTPPWSWGPTTTTAAAATTTTLPEVTTSAPASTTVTATTTSVVAVGPPPAPTTVAPVGDISTLTPEPALPRTGADLFSVAIAAILVGFGVGAVVVARRHP